MTSKPPPSSLRPAAGVPPSGNGKYIAVAVVLLLGVGGVVAWKMSQKPPEPVVVKLPLDAGPPPTQARNSLDDDVPPPPPVEDAGPEDAGKRTFIASAGDPCAVKSCGGKAGSDLEASLSFRAKQAHRCYDSALSQDPTLRGKISISVRIGANGAPCSASVASNDMGNAQVANCVANSFRSGNFPAPKGGCVETIIPINFVPRQ